MTLKGRLDAAARTMARVAQGWIPDTGVGQVLCYHLVGAGVGGPIDLDVPVFESHLAALVERGDVRPLEEVVRTGRGVALTFDDAFQNFSGQVWPRLREAQLPATLYVPTGFIDGSHGSPLSVAPNLPPCSWVQLQQMRDEGLGIGSHSAAHADMRFMAFSDAEKDVSMAKGRLEKMLGAGAAESFCFPRALVGKAALRAALTCHQFVVRGGGVSPRLTGGPIVRRTSVRAGGLPLDLLLGRFLVLEELLADVVRQARAVR
ncbi:MAG: polysaccharide deacetylase family protein [Acidobacteriota bacterium]|nr:polysaccharide deacetylase family protein [Acidobacteriota bacterium]